MTSNLRTSAATIAATVVTLGGGAAILAFLFTGTITEEAGLPIVTMLIGGATVWLWKKGDGNES